MTPEPPLLTRQPSHDAPFTDETSVEDIVAHARAKLRALAPEWWQEPNRIATFPAVVTQRTWQDPCPADAAPWLRFSAVVEFHLPGTDVGEHASTNESTTRRLPAYAARVSFDGSGAGAIHLSTVSWL